MTSIGIILKYRQIIFFCQNKGQSFKLQLNQTACDIFDCDEKV